MGLRKLGNRPWLVRDDFAAEELELKERLMRDPEKNVYAALGDTEEAEKAVLSLLSNMGVQPSNSASERSLERAGLCVQEDLCLMKRTDSGWVLSAASLCFPSRWNLLEKIGKRLDHIHEPVTGYRKNLSKKVDTFFDRLGNEPVWRRNWFIHPDNSLHQPERPPNGDPIIAFNEIGEKLFVRSERQTLRLIGIPGWILFTIRIQRSTLDDLLSKRKDEFREWIFEAPDSHHSHKGLERNQVNEIRKAL